MASCRALLLAAAPGVRELSLPRARAVLGTRRGRRVDRHADHLQVRIRSPEADLARGNLDEPER